MKSSDLSSACDGWHSVALSPGFSVRASGEAPPLDAVRSARVDMLWAQARRERPGLFDGRVFALDRLDPDGAAGRWTTYRRAYAQLRAPELFDPPLRALAVNGLVLTADDHVLIARRQKEAVYLPGGWQTAPAGSVEDRGEGDSVDLAAQLAAEAEEELGINAHELGDPRPLLAMRHPRTHVVDIGLAVRCTCDAATLRARFGQLREPEYDALETVPLQELRTLLASEPMLLPTARLLIEAWLASSR